MKTTNKQMNGWRTDERTGTIYQREVGKVLLGNKYWLSMENSSTGSFSAHSVAAEVVNFIRLLISEWIGSLRSGGLIEIGWRGSNGGDIWNQILSDFWVPFRWWPFNQYLRSNHYHQRMPSDSIELFISWHGDITFSGWHFSGHQ